MVTVYWKLDHQPFNNGNYGSTNTLTYYHDVIVNTAGGDSKDSFDFKVDNFQGEFDTTFNPKDKVTIYRQIDSSTGWSSDDVLMNGVIRQVPETEKYNQSLIMVKGYNHSETVTNALVFIDTTNGNYDVAELMQYALTSVQNFNENFKVTWHPNNPSVKTTGGSFPTIRERIFYKPLSYILEKYSGKDFTDDVNYYWYVDTQNRLVWRPRLDSVEATFDATTDEHLELKVDKDTKDVKNFIIVKAGLDPKNNPIQERYGDYNSIAKNGFKYHFLIDDNKTAQSLLDADRSDAGVDNMEDASYPFTPKWSGGTSYSNFDDYVAGFRAYVKAYAKQLGKDFADLYANGKLQVDLAFIPGTKSWGIGDMIACNIPQVSASNSKLLRVMKAQYTSTIDTFTLEEDVGSQ